MARSFAQDISEFCKKTKLKGALVIKKLGFDALRGVVMKSPVKTSRFQSNWRIAVNRVDLTFDPAARDQNGTMTIANGSKVMSSVKWGDWISISNNVPYAGPLETGTSKQAPQGVMGITFDEIKAGFALTVKAVTGS